MNLTNEQLQSLSNYFDTQNNLPVDVAHFASSLKVTIYPDMVAQEVAPTLVEEVPAQVEEVTTTPVEEVVTPIE